MTNKAPSPVLEEFKVHRNWTTLIAFCQTSFSDGQICFKIENAVPVDLNWKFTKNEPIKFDKGPANHLDFSKNGGSDTTIVMKVAEPWINMIMFIRECLPYGQFCVRVRNGEPFELVPKYCVPKIRFDKPETIPTVFVNFGEM